MSGSSRWTWSARSRLLRGTDADRKASRRVAARRPPGDSRAERRAASEAEALPFQVEALSGDAERPGSRVHLAVVRAERHLDHLALD